MLPLPSSWPTEKVMGVGSEAQLRVVVRHGLTTVMVHVTLLIIEV